MAKPKANFKVGDVVEVISERPLYSCIKGKKATVRNVTYMPAFKRYYVGLQITKTTGMVVDDPGWKGKPDIKLVSQL